VLRAKTLRARMMLLFCAVVGVLLSTSYLGFYALLDHVVHAQLDQRLLATAGPVVADLVADPLEQDVNQLDIPGQYFAVVDRSGRLLQRSKNLQSEDLDLGALALDISQPTFGSLLPGRHGPWRFVLVPFEQTHQPRLLLLAMPSRDVTEILGRFKRAILILLPLSLLLTAALSAWYVGRSVAPIATLTRHAAQMTERLGKAEQAEVWTPLAVEHPHDELGKLANTFNQLFERITSAVHQLRQFVSDAAHELRTPLSILQGETELMLSKPRSTQQYEKALRVIHDELSKLARMVEGLFTLSMADAGQLRLAREPLYLNEVLEEACVLVSPRAQAKDIAIQRDLNHEVVLYPGDEAFLRQLFLIFLDNALKYSPSHSTIRVELETVNGLARITFEDHGMGISREHLTHIFERFYRAAPSDDGEACSGGLGLAIAEAIARAQGGSIECASELGNGSKFTLSLPIEPTGADASAQKPPNTRPRQT
jgi:signal transduction histidine kinase